MPLPYKRYLSFIPPSIKNAIVYSGSQYLIVILNFAAILFSRSFVSPVLFGALAYVQAIQVYSRQIKSIFTNAVLLEIPKYSNSTEDFPYWEKFLASSHFSFIVILIIESVSYSFIAIFCDTHYLRIAFLGVAVISFFSELSNFYKITLLSKSYFNKIAILVTLSGIINIVLIIIFVIYWNDIGYIGALICAEIIRFAIYSLILIKDGLLRLKFHWNWSLTKTAIGIGLPVIAQGFLVENMQSIDRLFVKHYIGMEGLGYYSLAWSGIAVLNMLPSSIIGSYLPQHVHQVTLRDESLADKRNQIQGLLGSIMAIIIGFAFIAVPPLLNNFLPKYQLITLPFQILLIGAFFYSFSMLPCHIQIVHKRLSPLIIMPLVSTFIALVIYSYFAPYGLVAMAWSVAAVNIIYSIMTIFSVHENQDSKNMLKAMVIPTSCILILYILYFYFNSDILTYLFFIFYSCIFISKDMAQFKVKVP